MGLLLKLHLSSYVTKNTQHFSITANFIVLFLLRVMKDVILSCLITTLPQFMGMASVSMLKHIRLCLHVNVHKPVFKINRFSSPKRTS